MCPSKLVHARAHEMWHEMLHSLEHQGISKEIYLQISGKDEETLVTEVEPDAKAAIEREAVLAAIVEAETIEVSDDELIEAIVPDEAERAKVKKPEKLLARLKDAGRLDTLRESLAQRKAAELLVDSATAISVEQAQARKLLWTPEKEASEQPSPAASFGRLAS